MRLKGPLSFVADSLGIASSVMSFTEDGPDVEAFFNEVHERFDAIDTKLDDIEALLQEGFEEVVGVIEEGFAKEELDEWLNNGHLQKLRDAYKAFSNPDHSRETIVSYTQTFRESCQLIHTPYSIFKFLYSNTCIHL